MVNNPFEFGSAVTGETFIDRKNELKTVKNAMLNQQSLIIMSPRRYGKTSLVKEALNQLRLPYAFIDLEFVNNKIELCNMLLEKLLRNHPLQRIKKIISELIKIQPTILIRPDGSLGIEITLAGKNDRDVYLTDVLEFPQKLSIQTSKNHIVVFDEFQNVNRIDEHLTNQMRGAFQHHHNVGYVFIGSEESIIENIFQNKDSPFYRFGKHFTLDKIPKDEHVKGLLKLFKSRGIDAKKIINEILEFTRNHPQYTQQLCYEIYEVATGNNIINHEHKEIALKQIITHYNSSYSKWLNALSNEQRKILMGLAESNLSPYSNEFMQKYNIASSGTIRTAICALVDKDIIIKEGGKYVIEDPFFQEWLTRRHNH